MITLLQRNGMGNFGSWHSLGCYSAMCHPLKHYCRSATSPHWYATPNALTPTHNRIMFSDTPQTPFRNGSRNNTRALGFGVLRSQSNICGMQQDHRQYRGPNPEAPKDLLPVTCCQVPEDTLRGLLPIS